MHLKCFSVDNGADMLELVLGAFGIAQRDGTQKLFRFPKKNSFGAMLTEKSCPSIEYLCRFFTFFSWSYSNALIFFTFFPDCLAVRIMINSIKKFDISLTKKSD